MDTREIIDYDSLHVWHPYASMKNPLPSRLVESARGVRLKMADGSELIDGMSSWWAVAHGYNNPHINDAVCGQLEKMSHVMFGGLTHEPAVRLAKRLIDMTPPKLQKVFFCDSGSVSVEVAMKMALQYWHSLGRPEKNKFATSLGGYHGDTWHAMSVCDPVGGMHSMFAGGLPVSFFAPRPEPAFGAEWNGSSFAELEKMLRENAGEIAAFIIEPIVQGAGGMRFYHPEYLLRLRKICDELSILLILDEIATGFGRSGKMFACEYAGVEPDIMCLGKALTGGYVSFAATLATDAVADAISEGVPGLFMHGPTFMGNPLACAAANASLDLIQKDGLLGRIRRIEGILREGLSPLVGSKKVADVRALGAIGVVELKKSVDMRKFQDALAARGVWLRPFGRLLYTMPPYITDDGDLKTIARAMVETVEECAEL